MEVASPPKRMTRARAAARDKDSKEAATNTTTTTTAAAASSTAATKSTKAAASKSATASTAASKAKAVTTTRATKRKTRSDEDEDDNQGVAEKRAMNKPAKTRGRPKKVAEPEPQPEPQPEPEAEVNDAPTTTARATRGRAKKTATTTTTAAPPTATLKEEPAKTTRISTRAKKTATTTEDNSTEAPEKPAKKTTRARAASKSKVVTTGVITTTVSTEPTPGLKSAISRPASRIGGPVRKTVTFQEREKENLLPATGTKAKGKTAEPATGMRAKPVRKPAVGGRTTRASAKTETMSEKKDKSPLSPKKDAENRSLSRDADSDDELATLEKTPFKPLMKSPVKPPSSAKKLDLHPPTKEDDGDGEEISEPAGQAVLGSPARRPPSSSPWKDIMKSPAKKVEAIPSLILSSTNDQHAVQSPAKTSILHSPAKRPHMPIKALQPPSHESTDDARSPVKMSLLQSPAKRPTSPFKFQGLPAQPFGDSQGKLFAPKVSPVEEKAVAEEAQQEPFEHQEAMESEAEAEAGDEFELELELDAEADGQLEENDVEPESPSQLAFNGRLSAVLPRHADPALRHNPLPVENIDIPQPEPVQTEQAEAEQVETENEPIVEADGGELLDDPMDIDVPSPAPSTPPRSPPKRTTNPAFGLRAKDLDNDFSDSEDELANSGKTICKYQEDTTVNFSGVPATPTPATYKTLQGGIPSSAVKAASRAIRSVSKGSRFGFTPLANQFSEWKASSPQKSNNIVEPSSPEFKDEGFSMLKEHDTAPAEFTPTKGLFDEEMKIRAEMENQAAMEAALEADIAAKYDMPEFDDMPITKEDMELAAEANEMSIMEHSQLDETKDGRAYEDSISEASQEYGDENAVPIDPALLGLNAGGRRLGPVTPLRPSAPRPFHTVSKVPLKPADDSSPKLEITKNRSASASKLHANRPTGLFRNATVISYSPTKGSGSMDIDEDEPQYPPVTPTKSDIWSSIGTPARTPRRDLNTALLRGAVVFVDVHTSDGADASTVFVELLTQMGARCVKSWPWNPTSPTNSNGDASKVGITHVVFKDGGKRTLEKVRETGGVVQCVGVGWVLDCERENEWLDEAPYYIDTSLVPRGGRNRRKSMEPKALANFNGTLVTPMRNNTGPPRECQTVPNNHISRRDSTVWMRTPSDYDDEEDAPGEHDWDRELSMLTPVPKTPAPEAVARFAMDVTPDTPSTVDYNDLVSEREQLLMRTCPPKQSAYADLGEGLLKREKDQGILMRLMAARRKSLQFAPKVASPLSKAWN
ncbi:hypothetical protein F4818DRAFT_203322 [Hypoxylon cercidicola]|nr:hypothetical protein F4818DRAFT_203322 [Hypoxylon cercidicola]